MVTGENRASGNRAQEIVEEKTEIITELKAIIERIKMNTNC